MSGTLLLLGPPLCARLPASGQRSVRSHLDAICARLFRFRSCVGICQSTRRSRLAMALSLEAVSRLRVGPAGVCRRHDSHPRFSSRLRTGRTVLVGCRDRLRVERSVSHCTLRVYAHSPEHISDDRSRVCRTLRWTIKGRQRDRMEGIRVWRKASPEYGLAAPQGTMYIRVLMGVFVIDITKVVKIHSLSRIRPDRYSTGILMGWKRLANRILRSWCRVFVEMRRGQSSVATPTQSSTAARGFIRARRLHPRAPGSPAPSRGSSGKTDQGRADWLSPRTGGVLLPSSRPSPIISCRAVYCIVKVDRLLEHDDEW
jgi:hypothetical protein